MGKRKIGKLQSGKPQSLVRPNGKPRMGFFGCFDGAPDDQLMPQGEPDRPHALVFVLGPDHDALTKFCDALSRETKLPDLFKDKWARGRAKKGKRTFYQEKFMQACPVVMKQCPEIHIHWTAFKEHHLWGHLEGTLQNLVRFGCRPVDDHLGLWKIPPFRGRNGINSDGGMAPMSTLAVALWIAEMVGSTYEIGTRDCGHKPYLTLHTDRLPNDRQNAALSLIHAHLDQISLGRCRLQWTNPDRPDGDLPIDHLADHFCNWFLAATKNPTGKEGLAYAALKAAIEPTRIMLMVESLEKGRVEDTTEGTPILPFQSALSTRPLDSMENMGLSNEAR